MSLDGQSFQTAFRRLLKYPSCCGEQPFCEPKWPHGVNVQAALVSTLQSSQISGRVLIGQFLIFKISEFLTVARSKHNQDFRERDWLSKRILNLEEF